MNGPIIVTGPQRSGTTIAANILGHDLNRTVVDELHFNAQDKRQNIVCQVPSALQTYMIIYHFMQDVHFVYVKRDKSDIVQSMKRIQWSKKNVDYWEAFLDSYVDHCFKQWERLKEDLPKDCWSELPYKALSTHPLFVPKDQRTGFTSKQWQKDTPVGPRYWDDQLACIRELLNCERDTRSIKG